MSACPPRTWQSVRDEVLARIHRREWAPGALIPGEAALAREFGCARATVNRALQALAESGLLERRRRAGTRVTALPVRRATLEIPVIRREIEATGARYSLRLLENTSALAPTALREQLGLPAGTKMQHLRTLHLADGCPHVYEDRWLNPERLPALTEVDLRQLSINEWLVENVPFTRGDFSFAACSASADVAALLDCAPATALLLVQRSTWQHDAVITAVQLYYRPGYCIRTQL
ncbi:GntR family transcriptional regulator [Kineobactrum salinum]|uniref:UTRA domain-containing protein n=1 Tax=Kineobactrum salinum TaxID=2708301 RepID=A0A6C0U7W6_9GAMM|nr:GntR family transcriptional regulator [Kineobactrum salinum]QIB67087.1 UTRA domain-containing protein [Kineobactrum salinum]